MTGKPCSVCNGTRRAQHRGFSTACEHCDAREIRELRAKVAELEARLLLATPGGQAQLRDELLDYDF